MAFAVSTKTFIPGDLKVYLLSANVNVLLPKWFEKLMETGPAKQRCSEISSFLMA